jgi:hypothetical protein
LHASSTGRRATNPRGSGPACGSLGELSRSRAYCERQASPRRTGGGVGGAYLAHAGLPRAPVHLSGCTLVPVGSRAPEELGQRPAQSQAGVRRHNRWRSACASIRTMLVVRLQRFHCPGEEPPTQTEVDPKEASQDHSSSLRQGRPRTTKASSPGCLRPASPDHGPRTDLSVCQSRGAETTGPQGADVVNQRHPRAKNYSRENTK